MGQENPSSKLDVEFIYLPVISYSIQQDRIPVVRLFSIKDNTEHPFTDLKASLIFEPEFTAASPVMIERLSPGETIKVTTLNLLLDPSFSIRQAERFSDAIGLTVSYDEEVVFQSKYPIDILAFDQWGGAQMLPELLSAFAVPNHSILIGIISRTASILKE